MFFKTKFHGLLSSKICIPKIKLNPKMNKMDTETEIAFKLPTKNLIDPTGFDVTMSAVLIGLGAEKYIDIFKKNNIGQCTLMELNDEDLIKLGVDDPAIRKKLIEEVKNLPIYEDSSQINRSPNLDLVEIIDVLEESAQHLYRMYLSMITNTLALKKKGVTDYLIGKDKFASHVSVATLSQMTSILNSMDFALHTQIKVLSKESRDRKKKKTIVGTAGCALIAVLSIFFIRSLKNIH